MSNKHILSLFIILSGIFIFLASPGLAAGGKNMENACVNCHSKLPSNSFVGVKSHDWKGSIHQRHNVTCDKCHGGKPDAIDKEEAHRGVLSSSNPKSRVYYKNIPSTCGGCHGAEFYKFTQSYHFKKLEATGKGPNCVTCHGSMVTTVLKPDDIANVCVRCHNTRIGVYPYIPQKARAVLLLLRESKALLMADKKLYKPVRGSAEEAYLRKARASLYSAKLGWHKFDLNAIIRDLQEVDAYLEKLSGSSSSRP